MKMETQEDGFGAFAYGEIAYLVKYLPPEHKDQSSVPQHPRKMPMWWSGPVIPVLGRQRHVDPWGSIAS